MSLWWASAPLVLVAGSALLATLSTLLTRELETLIVSLQRLERVGVAVDDTRHDVERMRRSVPAAPSSARYGAASTER